MRKPVRHFDENPANQKVEASPSATELEIRHKCGTELRHCNCVVTTDLRTIAPLLQTNDTLWSHHSGWWLLDMTALIVVGVVPAGCVRWRIRLNAESQTLDRTAWYRQLRAAVVTCSDGALVGEGMGTAHPQPRRGRFRRWGGIPLSVGERRREAVEQGSGESDTASMHLRE